MTVSSSNTDQHWAGVGGGGRGQGTDLSAGHLQYATWVPTALPARHWHYLCYCVLALCEH